MNMIGRADRTGGYMFPFGWKKKQSVRQKYLLLKHKMIVKMFKKCQANQIRTILTSEFYSCSA